MLVQLRGPGGERILAVRSPRNPLKQLTRGRMSLRYLPGPENRMPAYSGIRFVKTFLSLCPSPSFHPHTWGAGICKEETLMHVLPRTGVWNQPGSGGEMGMQNQIWSTDFIKRDWEVISKLRLFYDFKWILLPKSEQKGPSTCPNFPLEQGKATSHWWIFKKAEGEVLFRAYSLAVLLQRAGCSDSQRVSGARG